MKKFSDNRRSDGHIATRAIVGTIVVIIAAVLLIAFVVTSDKPASPEEPYVKPAPVEQHVQSGESRSQRTPSPRPYAPAHTHEPEQAHPGSPCDYDIMNRRCNKAMHVKPPKSPTRMPVPIPEVTLSWDTPDHIVD